MAELFMLRPLFPGARYASEFSLGHCSSHFNSLLYILRSQMHAELRLLLN